MLWRSMQISEGLPRFQTSLFRCKFARKGRREGENGREDASPLFFLLPPSHGLLRFATLQFRFALAFVRDQTAKKTNYPRRRKSVLPIMWKPNSFVIYYLLNLITFFPLHLADSSVGLISALRSLGSGLVSLREDTLGSHLPNSARLVIEPNASAVYCPCNLVSWSIYHLSI